MAKKKHKGFVFMMISIYWNEKPTNTYESNVTLLWVNKTHSQGNKCMFYNKKSLTFNRNGVNVLKDFEIYIFIFNNFFLNFVNSKFSYITLFFCLTYKAFESRWLPIIYSWNLTKCQQSLVITAMEYWHLNGPW